MRMSIIAAAAVPMLFATPAFAVESSVSATSASAPAAVWAKIGDFCGIGKWHPAVAKCALSAEDKIRTLDHKGGGVIHERQEARDDSAYSYSYSIVDGPLPVANYLSTLSVTPDGAGSKLTWTGKYDAKGVSDADAKKVIDGIYQGGLDALVK